MSPLYLLVVLFVTSLLLALPLFPFWKFCSRLKSHHPAAWASQGPFDLRTVLATSGAFANLVAVVRAAALSLDAAGNDPVLLKWARLAAGVWKLSPRSFLAQVGYTLVLLYFIFIFSAGVMAVIT